jgi:tRNA (adenine57-N1/adenine58-N1)-methyltransferase
MVIKGDFMEKELLFSEGDWVIVCDKKHRERMFSLKKGKQFSLYNRQFKHDILIGMEAGAVLFKHTSQPVYVFRPSLRDYVMNMKRNVQPIYPKDLGLMVYYADLFPGASVLEVGLGAGALSMSILNAVGDEGNLVTYERRDDFASQGRKRVEAFLGEKPNFKVVLRDAASGIDEVDFDAAFIGYLFFCISNGKSLSQFIFCMNSDVNSLSIVSSPFA